MNLSWKSLMPRSSIIVIANSYRLLLESDGTIRYIYLVKHLSIKTRSSQTSVIRYRQASGTLSTKSSQRGQLRRIAEVRPLRRRRTNLAHRGHRDCRYQLLPLALLQLNTHSIQDCRGLLLAQFCIRPRKPQIRKYTQR